VTAVLRGGPDLQAASPSSTACCASATDIIRCPALIRLLRHQWTQHAGSSGWEDPLADQEDAGHDPWGAYGAFEKYPSNVHLRQTHVPWAQKGVVTNPLRPSPSHRALT
jgi:hypothetical protein